MNTKKPLLCWLSWFCASNVILFWLLGLRYITGITPFFPTASFSAQCVTWLFSIVVFASQPALLAFLPTILTIAHLYSQFRSV